MMVKTSMAVAKATLRELVSLRASSTVAINEVSQEDEEYQIVTSLQEEAIPTLLGLLEDGLPQTKIRALALLEIIIEGRDELIETLLSTLQKVENHFIEIYIAEIIALINTSKSESALINLYTEKKEYRWPCLHGIMRPNEPRFGSRQLICLEACYDCDYKIRNLVRTLLRDKLWAKPFFLKLVLEQTNDPVPIVRTGALKTLKECFPEEKLAQTAIKKALHDTNDSTKRMAASLLQGIDCQDIENDLYEILNSQFETVKTRAFAASVIASSTDSPQRLCQSIVCVIKEQAIQIAMPDNIYPTVPFVDLCRILIRYKESYPSGVKHLEELFYCRETDKPCQDMILDLIEEWEKSL